MFKCLLPPQRRTGALSRSTYFRRGDASLLPSGPGVNGPRFMSFHINNVGLFEKNHMPSLRAKHFCLLHESECPFLPGLEPKNISPPEGSCFGSPARVVRISPSPTMHHGFLPTRLDMQALGALGALAGKTAGVGKTKPSAKAATGTQVVESLRRDVAGSSESRLELKATEICFPISSCLLH